MFSLSIKSYISIKFLSIVLLELSTPSISKKTAIYGLSIMVNDTPISATDEEIKDIKWAFSRTRKPKKNIKGKRKRGLIVPLFLAYQYVIHRSVQQPAQGIQIVDRRKALTVLPFRHRLSCHITCLSNVILCKLILFSVKLNIVTYQNKYLQFNLYPKLYLQVAESKENIGCKCTTLGGLLFNLAFYVYKAYIFSVPRCSNGLNSSLKESDFDQSILETNVPNERIAFLGFT